MIERILIDGGINQQRNCMGRRGDAPSHAYRIGEALSMELEKMGYETLFSGNVPELAEHEGAGRPGVCAAVARKWNADVVFRLCIRAAELPEIGTARAMVFRKNTLAWRMAESVLNAIEEGSMLDSQGVKASPRFLLLRRTACPGMILVLGLPFRQKEFLFDTEVKNYAECIAEGIHAWADCERT